MGPAPTQPGRVGYRFVEEATLMPLTSRQLRCRAALALHAAVGLDLQVRDDVERLLLSRYEDRLYPLRCKRTWRELQSPGTV